MRGLLLKGRERGIKPFDAGLAVMTGLLLTASFPRTDCGFVAWVAFVPLFSAIKDKRPSSSLMLGLLAGLVHYGTLLYWIAGVAYYYGQLPLGLCILVLLLLVFYLSLYPGLFAMFINRLSARSVPYYLAAPFIWVALEYVKSFFLSGFPWENLGYSQHNWLRLIQISDIFGIYGLSAILMAVNGAFFEGFYAFSVGRGFAWKPLLGVTLVLAGLLTYGTWRIEHIDRAVEGAPKRTIGLIQGNIDQSLKWLPSFQHETLRRYGALSAAALKKKPDLIIWPETALPFYFLEDEELTDKTLDLVRKSKVDFVLGSPSFSRMGQQTGYYNSAYLVNRRGHVIGKYDKVHLVPYGEYVPLKRYFPFIGKMVQAVGDFDSGKPGQVLVWQDHKIGVLICFEAIFPELAGSMARNGAELLVNITNDAWFGRSSAPYQHLSMVVFRAVENHLAVARAANTGVSAFVDPVGRVLDETPLFEDAVRTHTLPLMKAKSFYAHYGDVFALGCVVMSLVICIISFRRQGENFRFR
jgi:apolipoprotein N-acyltransferase